MKKHEALKISCRLELLPGNSSVEKIENAARFGFDAVALPGRFMSGWLGELRGKAGSLPVPCSAISLGFEGSLVAPSAATRSKCAESLRRLFEICAGLGVPNLNMPPVLTADNPARLADADRQDRLLKELLPPLAGEARKSGVRILLEPVNRYESEYMNTLGHAARLCAEMADENIGVTADLFHMQMEELDIPSAILSAGKWVQYVHVADNTRVEPGRGSMNFQAAFAALHAIGYSGFVEVESRKLSGPPEKVLPNSVKILKSAMRAALEK